MAYSEEKTFPGWMKNSSYYRATAGILTSDLPHSMAMSKKVTRFYQLDHRGGIKPNTPTNKHNRACPD